MKFEHSVRRYVCLASVALLTVVGCDNGGPPSGFMSQPLATNPSEKLDIDSRQFEFEYAAEIQGVP
ncbi:MAG: hypothetical protein GY880_21455, partial [Planctomycetaceae bacterium]|nr:hypothetical protein [Planctomycetaceae bacterium]